MTLCRALLPAAPLLGVLAGCALPPPQFIRHEHGETVTLDEFHGQVVVINYWATWCQPCMSEIPSLVRVVREWEGHVVFLAVNENDEFYGRPRVAHWLAKNPASFTRYIVYGNAGVLAKFPRQVFPTTYVLDVDGNVVDKVAGSLTEAQARAMIMKALERSAFH